MKKIVFFLTAFLWLTSASFAKTTSEGTTQVPMVDSMILNIFSDMEKVFLSRLDKICLSGSVDNVPFAALVRQDDLMHLEAIVLRREGTEKGVMGYLIKLSGFFAKVDDLSDKEVIKSQHLRSLDLWTLPFFSSEFRLGDFLPGLFLQMRLTGQEVVPYLGAEHNRLTGLLSADKTHTPSSLSLFINKASKLPAGFQFYDEDKKRTRSLEIRQYGIFQDKKYAKEIEASDALNAHKSVLEIQQIVPMKPEASSIDFSQINAGNWKNFCSGI